MQASGGSSWPVDLVLANLKSAWIVFDAIKSKFELQDGKPDNPKLSDRKIAEGVVLYYQRNKFIISSQFLLTMNEYSLGGGKNDDAKNRVWKEHLAYVFEALSSLRGSLTTFEPVDFSKPVSRAERGLWSFNSYLKPAFIFDARENSALSVILLTDSKGKAPALRCAEANALLQQSGDEIPTLVKENYYHADDAALLRGHHESIKQRIEKSC